MRRGPTPWKAYSGLAAVLTATCLLFVSPPRTNSGVAAGAPQSSTGAPIPLRTPKPATGGRRRRPVRDPAQPKNPPPPQPTSTPDARPKPSPSPAATATPPAPAVNGAQEEERRFWERVRGSKDSMDFVEYLNRYPGGAHSAEARSQLEEFQWGWIKESKDPKHFESFLKEYPGGKYGAQARARLEELEWGRIEKSDDPESFRAHLRKYRGGAYEAQARRRLAETEVVELVRVAPGSFMMGSNTISSDERPVHRVTFGEGFYMGKYEVTIAQWRRVMGGLPEGMRRDLGADFMESDRQPVVRVSWDDAQEFIRRLNERDSGYHYRLPAEAEWEYACRAGTTGDFAGDLEELAWYEHNSGGHTHPVGTKRPNAFGLYDMHGNVLEWCEDLNHQNYEGAPADGSAWVKGGESRYRLLRGGSWSKPAAELLSARRRRSKPGYFSQNTGLRVAADALQ